MNKRAVTYRRASTEEQIKHGTGLGYQEQACREYVARLGFDLVGELADEGVSGSVPIAERAGGAELYRLVSAHAVDAVVVTRSDRLSRDEWAIELALFHKHCAQNGVTIHLVDEGGAVVHGMGGKLILTLGDMMAGEERAKITQRMTDGRRARARSGILLVCGPVPYGYHRVLVTDNERPRYDLVIDDVQGTVVREMYRLYTEEGLSLRALSIHLTKKQIPAPKKRWWRQALRRILKSPRYLGEFVYSGIVVQRPDLALIDRATFDHAQHFLATNKQNSPRRTKHEYLFRSRLKCECGHKMPGRPMNRGRYLRYVCSTYYQEQARCARAKAIDARYLDAMAWEELLRVLNNSKLLKDAAREYLERQEERLQPKRELLAALVSERVNAERLADEYVRLAGRAGVNSQLLAKYESEAETELARVKRVAHEIEALQRDLSHAASYDEHEIEKVVDQVQSKLAHGNPTFAQRRQLVERMNVIGELHGEDVKFKLEIGLTFTVAHSVSPSSLSSPRCRAARRSG